MTFENPPLISSSEEPDILYIAVNQTEIKEKLDANNARRVLQLTKQDDDIVIFGVDMPM